MSTRKELGKFRPAKTKQAKTKRAKTKLGEKGATAIEYGLIAALISVVIIAALTLTGNSLKNTFNRVGSTLSSAAASN